MRSIASRRMFQLAVCGALWIVLRDAPSALLRTTGYPQKGPRPRGSVRREDLGAVERPHLGRHQPLRPRTEPRQHGVARLRVDEAVPAQRLHVDKDVLRALAAREEAKAAGPVEPFDDDD